MAPWRGHTRHGGGLGRRDSGPGVEPLGRIDAGLGRAVPPAAPPVELVITPASGVAPALVPLGPSAAQLYLAALNEMSTKVRPANRCGCPAICRKQCPAHPSAARRARPAQHGS